MAGWFELSKSSDNQFRFVLKAGNGETILTSELYTSKASAEKGIASVRSNSPQEERGNDSNLLIVFYVQIMPDDFVMQLHRF